MRIGGYDHAQKIREFEGAEKDQRRRLEKVLERLVRLERESGVVDGYTSSTEETTFVSTLIEELPNIMKK